MRPAAFAATRWATALLRSRLPSVTTPSCDVAPHRRAPLAARYRAVAMATPISPPQDTDTIFAVATPTIAASGVAVIRISGPASTHALQSLLRPPGSASAVRLPEPRRASLRDLHHPTTGAVLDSALVLLFRTPHSYTGDDIVELHVHGSLAVLSAVTDALSAVSPPTPRPAGRGEFSRRAFENGRLKLTQAEALADLIAAQTDAQRVQALHNLRGGAEHRLAEWRAQLTRHMAHVEAVIDFGDDVPDSVFDGVLAPVRALRDALCAELAAGARGELVRGGASVAIVGRPNAGKSTLLNALAQRDAAIVSPMAGTTRDVVQVVVDVCGMPVTVCDTAGVRRAARDIDAVEREGMRRATRAACNAHVVVVVHDAAADAGVVSDAAARDVVLREVMHRDDDGGGSDDSARALPAVVHVLNKMDLVTGGELTAASAAGHDDGRLVRASLASDSKDAVRRIVGLLEAELRERAGGGADACGGEQPMVTRARHKHHIGNAAAALTRFLEGRSAGHPTLWLPMDLAAEELRIAAKELGAMSGAIDNEEVLDVVFSEFCIGK